MCPSTEMLISVQKYKLQYGKISPVLSTPNNSSSEKKYQSLSKKKHKFQNKHIHRLCDYILHSCIQQYINIFPSTKIKVSVQKNYKRKIGEIGRYFIYDYYHVPKHMLIIVYLNKPYIFHCYRLSRLNTTIHLYTTPCITIQHRAPLHLTKYH